MQIAKSEAERILGVSYTTFYNWVNKLGIELITKIDTRGKSSYINWEDLQKMATAMGKSIEEQSEKIDGTPQKQIQQDQQNKNGAEQDDKIKEIQQENFTLQLRIQQQEESLKANNEVITLYKEQTQQLQNGLQQAQSQFNMMYLQLIKASNKATAFLIASIALALLLILFIGLVIRGKLKF